MAVEDTLMDSFYRRLNIVQIGCIFMLLFCFYLLSFDSRILFHFSAHLIPFLRAFYSVSRCIGLQYCSFRFEMGVRNIIG